MMGHINNLVIEMVRRDKGEKGVKQLFQEAALPVKEYQPEVIYPEEEFQAIFKGAQAVYGVDSETAERAFSAYFVEVSPKYFHWFFKLAPNARAFLEKVPQIHRNFPAAVSVSKFQEKLILFKSDKDHLVYQYRSPNRLCVTLKTIAELVLERFHEKGEVSETECMKKGDAACMVTIRFWGPKGASSPRGKADAKE